MPFWLSLTNGLSLWPGFSKQAFQGKSLKLLSLPSFYILTSTLSLILSLCFISYRMSVSFCNTIFVFQKFSFLLNPIIFSYMNLFMWTTLFLKIYLLIERTRGIEKESEKERKREIKRKKAIYPLAQSPHDCNNRTGQGPDQEHQTPFCVSHMGGRAIALGPYSILLTDALSGSWIISGTIAAWKCAHMECWHCRFWFNLMCYKAGSDKSISVG